MFEPQLSAHYCTGFSVSSDGHGMDWRRPDRQFLNLIDQLLVSSLDPVSLPIAKGGKAASPLMLSTTSSEEYRVHAMEY